MRNARWGFLPEDLLLLKTIKFVVASICELLAEDDFPIFPKVLRQKGLVLDGEKKQHDLQRERDELLAEKREKDLESDRKLRDSQQVSTRAREHAETAERRTETLRREKDELTAKNADLTRALAEAQRELSQAVEKTEKRCREDISHLRMEKEALQKLLEEKDRELQLQQAERAKEVREEKENEQTRLDEMKEALREGMLGEFEQKIATLTTKHSTECEELQRKANLQLAGIKKEADQAKHEVSSAKAEFVKMRDEIHRLRRENAEGEERAKRERQELETAKHELKLSEGKIRVLEQEQLAAIEEADEKAKAGGTAQSAGGTVLGGRAPEDAAARNGEDAALKEAARRELALRAEVTRLEDLLGRKVSEREQTIATLQAELKRATEQIAAVNLKRTTVGAGGSTGAAAPSSVVEASGDDGTSRVSPTRDGTSPRGAEGSRPRLVDLVGQPAAPESRSTSSPQKEQANDLRRDINELRRAIESISARTDSVPPPDTRNNLRPSAVFVGPSGTASKTTTGRFSSPLVVEGATRNSNYDRAEERLEQQMQTLRQRRTALERERASWREDWARAAGSPEERQVLAQVKRQLDAQASRLNEDTRSWRTAIANSRKQRERAERAELREELRAEGVFGLDCGTESQTSTVLTDMEGSSAESVEETARERRSAHPFYPKLRSSAGGRGTRRPQSARPAPLFSATAPYHVTPLAGGNYLVQTENPLGASLPAPMPSGAPGGFTGLALNNNLVGAPPAFVGAAPVNMHQPVHHLVPPPSIPLVPSQPHVDLSNPVSGGSRPPAHQPLVDPELRRAALDDAMVFRTRHSSRDSTAERWSGVLHRASASAADRDLIRKDDAALSARSTSQGTIMATPHVASKALSGGAGDEDARSVDTISTSRQHGNYVRGYSKNFRSALAQQAGFMRGAADEFSSALKREERSSGRPWTARG